MAVSRPVQSRYICAVQYSTSTLHRVNPIITIGCLYSIFWSSSHGAYLLRTEYIGIEISSSFILIEIVHWMDRQATPCHTTHTPAVEQHWRSSPESLGRYQYGVKLVFDIFYITTDHGVADLIASIVILP